MDAVSHLLRRSRRSFGAGAGHAMHDTRAVDLDLRLPAEVDWTGDKRNMIDMNSNLINHGQSQQPAVNGGQVINAGQSTGSPVAANAPGRAAAGAATHGTTINTSGRTTATSNTYLAQAASSAPIVNSALTPPTSTAPIINPAANLPTSTAPVLSQVPAVSSASAPAVASAVSSAISSAKSSTSSALPTTKVAIPTSPSAAATSSSTTPTVLTITQSSSTHAASSASAAATVNAAAADLSKTSSVSTGGIAGAVVGAIAGIVVLAALLSWLYRKHTSRSYSAGLPWAKIEDDEITPFPPAGEKSSPSDDIYGSTTGPVMGSRRALALARNNAFNPDGSLRPDSDYIGDNHAGYGAGGYSDHAPAPAYGLDMQGRPYNPQAGRTPMLHTYRDEVGNGPQAGAPPVRQLLGPNGYNSGIVPVPMGRPAAPATQAELAQHEDFADLPNPEPILPGYTLAYDDQRDGDYTPHTATTMGEWAGGAQPQGRTGLSATNPTPASASLQTPLPMLAPLSPLSTGFDLHRSSTQPLVMYADDASQKRMYGEVAQAAGIAEPLTPNPPATLHESMRSNSTSSSFSANHPMARLPNLTLAPPRPYMHGQPLSPLNELPTPQSYISNKSSGTNATALPLPLPSSSIGHARAEVNPFDDVNAHTLVPSYSSSSAFPSPNFPPPSPGNMSVPGSINDSPRRWSGGPASGPARGRGVSMFDGDDAYGGI